MLYSLIVVITETPQKIILREFRVGHLGISMVEALMHSYVYWTKSDREIENLVKVCSGCAPAAKLPTIKSELWSKVDLPLSRLRIDFTGPLSGSY